MRFRMQSPIGVAVCTALSSLACLAWAPAVASGVVPDKGVASLIGSTGAAGGQLNTPRGVAVDQVSGNAYVADSSNNRISVFAPSGSFLRAFGQDVVESGPGNNGTGYEICVAANGDVCKAGSTAASTGGAMQAPQGVALDDAGNVYVSEQNKLRVQKFDANGNFLLTFGKNVTINGSPSDPGNVTGTQVCSVAAHCQIGETGSAGGEFKSTFNGYLAVAPTGAPNAGNVLVADPANLRVQEFTAAGVFVRTFGFDVTTGGVATFEVCSVAANCKIGVTGSGSGQFSASVNRVAEDAGGNVYTVESGSPNFRVQRFSLPANVVTPEGPFSEANLKGTNAGTAPLDVAVDPSTGNLLVTKAFPAGATPTCLATGSASVAERRILELSSSGALEGTHMACAAINAVNGIAVRGSSGAIYASSTTGGSRVFVLGNVPAPSATVEPATDVTPEEATLHGTVGPSINPGSLKTSYRFEYSKNGFEWTKAPAVDANLGNGSAGGASGSCPTPEAAACSVSQPVSGLDPNREYEVRLVARTEFNGAWIVDTGVTFTTGVAVPESVTDSALWSSPTATKPSLLLSGRVNPKRDSTSYYFEYVDDANYQQSGFAKALRTPLESAGRGLALLSVSQVVFGLDPSPLYHYRLVATNSSGTGVGAEREISPPSPGDRFYELVSEGDSWGVGVARTIEAVGNNGSKAMFLAQAFDRPESTPGPSSSYVTERGPEGWQVRPMFPDPEGAQGAYGLGNGQEAFLTPDLDKTLWPESDGGERLRSEVRWALHDIEGAVVPALPPIVPLMRVAEASAAADAYVARGAAADLSSFVFQFDSTQGNVSLLEGEPLLQGTERRSNLYQVIDAGEPGARLAIVNRASNPSPGVPGPIIGGSCGAGLGAGTRVDDKPGFRPVSVDGSIIYFSAIPGSAPAGEKCNTAGDMRLFKRVDDEVTVAVSEPQCTRVSPPCSGSGSDLYQNASGDGSVVFFTSPRQLTDSDLDGATVTGTANVSAGSTSVTNVVTAQGTGTLSSGSKNVTGVATSSGDFLVGQTITGAGIAPGTTIAAVGAGTIELSANATSSGPQSLSAGAAPFAVGQRIAGPGIPSSATVTAISGQTLTISSAATTSGAGASISGWSECGVKLDACDLYAYDAKLPPGERLVQASAGETVGGHVTGIGARVLRVVNSAADGSRAYFVAEGALTGPNAEGKSPTAGQRNLYVFQRDAAHPAGRVAFIGTLAGFDDFSPFHALPMNGAEGDGRFLVFTSSAKLLAMDTDSSADLYRYDDPSEELLCLSCVKNGFFDVKIPSLGVEDIRRAWPDREQRARPASADASTVVFTTAEQLLASDQNSVADVYAWHENAPLELISGATDQAGVEAIGTAPTGISPDGKNVFFLTSAALVASDVNGQLDVYDARIGGGHPAMPGDPLPCIGDAGCRGSATPPAESPPTPGSASFSGPGNQASAPVRKCPKGKVRKKGKCVKKHKRKKARHGSHKRDDQAKKAGHGRRGGE